MKIVRLTGECYMRVSKIGKIIVSIIGTDKTYDLVSKELDAKEDGSDSTCFDICLNINEKTNFIGYKPKIFSAKGKMNFNESEFYVDYLRDFSYSVKGLFKKKNHVVNVDINAKQITIVDVIKSFLVSKTEKVKNSILSYSLFWYLIHVQLLKINGSFVHSSVIYNSKTNKSLLITGTGGCGKTSIIIELLNNNYFYYVAEDFGIVDSDGNTFFNPKAISIYATDIEHGQSQLKEYFNSLSIKEKAVFFLKRRIFKMNPLFKISPHILFKNKIKNKSKIEHVIYFSRRDVSQFEILNISYDKFINRILNASMRELKTLNELLMLMNANAPDSYLIPSFEEIQQKTRSVYSKAFLNTKNKLLIIPHKSTPNEVLDFLKEQSII